MPPPSPTPPAPPSPPKFNALPPAPPSPPKTSLSHKRAIFDNQDPGRAADATAESAATHPTRPTGALRCSAFATFPAKSAVSDDETVVQRDVSYVKNRSALPQR